jgi:hypothetical protein
MHTLAGPPGREDAMVSRRLHALQTPVYHRMDLLVPVTGRRCPPERRAQTRWSGAVHCVGLLAQSPLGHIIMST